MSAKKWDVYCVKSNPFDNNKLVLCVVAEALDWKTALLVKRQDKGYKLRPNANNTVAPQKKKKKKDSAKQQKLFSE